MQLNPYHLLFALLCFCQPVRSQTLHANSGFVVSTMVAKFDPVSENIFNSSYKSQFPRYFNKVSGGWRATFGVDYLDKKHFYLSSDIGAVQNGSLGSESYQNGNDALAEHEVQTAFTFLTLNTLAHAKIIDNEIVTLQFGLGLQANFLLFYGMPDLNSGFDILYPFEDYLAPVSGDLASEFGLAIKLTQFRIGLKTGYNMSAFHVLDARVRPNWDLTGDAQIELRVNYFSANFSLGYCLESIKGDRKSGQAPIFSSRKASTFF